jgi:hypothetical protein
VERLPYLGKSVALCHEAYLASSRANSIEEARSHRGASEVRASRTRNLV